jgi:hypothetical protein
MKMQSIFKVFGTKKVPKHLNIEQTSFIPMKRGFNCKGDIPSQALFFLFEVLMVMVVLVALLSYVDSLRKSTLFEKNYLSRDIALTLDTLGTLPGNIFYLYSNYRVNLSKFDIDFTNNLVSVNDKGQQSGMISFQYAQNMLLRQDIFQSSYKNIDLLKAGNTFSSRHSTNLEQFSTLFYEPEENNNTKVLFDPFNGSSDETTKKTFGILKIIDGQFKIQPDSFRMTRDDSTTVSDISSKNQLINKFEPYAIIGITIGSYNLDKNYIKAYYNVETKQIKNTTKFASFILNSISAKINDRGIIDGLGIIPINTNELEADSQMQMLKNDNVAIVLEIGNIQSDKGKKMLEQHTGDIGAAIFDGIKNYFTYENKKIK